MLLGVISSKLFHHLLLPVAIISTIYLYLYPIFRGCAFPLPAGNSSSSLDAIRSAFCQHYCYHHSNNGGEKKEKEKAAADFRLLVLADPQLEGDSSLPDKEDELGSRLSKHWEDILLSYRSTKNNMGPTTTTIRNGILLWWNTIAEILTTDIPASLAGFRKRVDLLGNDYYLAHVYRTMHWWSRPTHVAVLGDLLGSQWIGEGEFDLRGRRYWDRVFRGGEKVHNSHHHIFDYGGMEKEKEWSNRIINVVGNHDIGYAGEVNRSRIDRFERVFGPVNWDVRFRYHPSSDPLPEGGGGSGKTPSLHLINLNSLVLDTPALSEEIQAETYRYMNEVIRHRSKPVGDPSSFTLLLTHVPLHKEEGICTDGPRFEFHEHDDDDDDDDKGPGYREGGLKGQNHLSQHVSSHAILEGIFGLSGNTDRAPNHGLGRNGLILTGHDHSGCDVLHYVDDDEGGWKWRAKPYSNNATVDTPSIREITLRSMMGEYGGNAGLLSIWFDEHDGSWKYDFATCAAGLQHIWWFAHALVFVTCVSGLWVWWPYSPRRPDDNLSRPVHKNGGVKSK